MKNYLFSFMVVLLLVSCIETEDNYNTSTCLCPENTVSLSTRYISVYPSDWKSYNSTSEHYSYATFDLDDITETVLNYGAVMCYFIAERDNLLPYIFPVKTENSDTIMHNYRFDLEQGAISFILESSDTKIYLPQDTLDFKVSIFCPN